MIDIKVKLVLEDTPNETIEFIIDSNNTFSYQDGGECKVNITQFQSLIKQIISLKRWLEYYRGLKIEIEKE